MSKAKKITSAVWRAALVCAEPGKTPMSSRPSQVLRKWAEGRPELVTLSLDQLSRHVLAAAEGSAKVTAVEPPESDRHAHMVWLEGRIAMTRKKWNRVRKNPRSMVPGTLTYQRRLLWFEDLASYVRRFCGTIFPRSPDKLRAYTESGDKVFLPFDIHAFNAVMLGTARREEDFGNATLEKALSAATGNVDEAGNEHSYLKLEWLCRNPETGKPTFSDRGKRDEDGVT